MLNFLRRLIGVALGTCICNYPGSWLRCPVHAARHPWRAIRFQGGGILQSPRDMTEEEACKWVAVVIKGEIAFIDREYGFIFYRPKE